jgi:hypothetical protein
LVLRQLQSALKGNELPPRPLTIELGAVNMVPPRVLRQLNRLTRPALNGG